MNWTITPAQQLTPAQADAWRQLLVEAPHYESPYFTCEYVQLVATLLPNIEVAMLHQDSRLAVVFPFERARGDIAEPVGRELADYQGAVYRQGFEFDVPHMLRALRLRRWRFDHLFPAAGPVERWCWTTWKSWQINVSGGCEKFLENFYARHKNVRRNVKRSNMKLSAEVGAVRLELDSKQPELLELMLEWKCRQYELSGRIHPFRYEWVRSFLRDAVHLECSNFRGNLAVLYAGAKPLAMEYCLQSKRAAHALISAFDPDYANFSPGLLCSFELACAYSRAGFCSLDLGKGLEAYKQRLVDQAPVLGEGCVDLSLPRAWLTRNIQRSRYRFLRSRWSAPAKRLAHKSAAIMPNVRRIFSMR